MERPSTYLLASVGLAKGVFEVFIKPIPSDMAAWIGGKLLPFEIDYDAIEQHLRDVAGEDNK